MIKRLVVFFIFVSQGMSAMHVNNKEYPRCLRCQEFFDMEARRRVLLTCCQIAQQLLVTNPYQESLKEECRNHSLCLTCLRHILVSTPIVCPSCGPEKKITVDELYEIGGISLNEYCAFYISKFGLFVGKKLIEAKRIIDDLDEDIGNNIHPLAIELSGLLN